ncbi:MAG: ferrous iron transport protein A [PVC group bacterium]|nr:ferrous iron transport protein A [PVC group bacterium]
MADALMPLFNVPEGKEVTVTEIGGGQALRRRLTAMGLNEGVKLKVLHSHGRGACVILVQNTRLMLGHGMAHKIMVKG